MYTARYTLMLLAAAVTSTAIPTTSSSQSPLHIPSSLLADSCDCTGTNSTKIQGTVCGDPRLGPINLPAIFPLLAVVNDYNRLGGLQPGEFLAKYWNSARGSWYYPEQDGFLLTDEGHPIWGNTTLAIGTKLDRFGSEGGQYVSEAEAPYDQRSLPPQNLNHDAANPDFPNSYHVYRVIKPLPVLAGPIAPYYGQAGLGAQFYTGYVGRIYQLKAMGYIRELNKTELDAPGKKKGPCG